MALTGRFTFRRTFWGKIVLQVEEEVRPIWRFWQQGARRRRWRDATLMDLAAVELRPLMDLRSRPRFDWERLYQPRQEEPRVRPPANDAWPRSSAEETARVSQRPQAAA
jgi:hypothetical protein